MRLETVKRETLMSHDTPICDYEGSDYVEFWNGRGYEDSVERVALGRLLPAGGERLIDLGAGFGRLADLYAPFKHVVLMDRAFSQMQEARKRLRGDPHIAFVVADVYALPFAADAADNIISVRMLHHLVDVPKALHEITRVLRGGGTYITEYASKRNLKAMLRYALHRQRENPFSEHPHEFVRLNFDFHPNWMERQLQRAGLRVEARRAISHFRVNALKRTVPTPVLVTADRALQRVGGLWPWTPSIFVRTRKTE